MKEWNSSSLRAKGVKKKHAAGSDGGWTSTWYVAIIHIFHIHHFSVECTIALLIFTHVHILFNRSKDTATPTVKYAALTCLQFYASRLVTNLPPLTSHPLGFHKCNSSLPPSHAFWLVLSELTFFIFVANMLVFPRPLFHARFNLPKLIAHHIKLLCVLWRPLTD